MVKSIASRGEEWVWLQHVFQLLQMCGDLWLQNETLDEQIQSSLSQVAMEMCASASATAPFNSYDYLAVYHPEERTTTMALLDNVKATGAGEASLYQHYHTGMETFIVLHQKLKVTIVLHQKLQVTIVLLQKLSDHCVVSETQSDHCVASETQ